MPDGALWYTSPERKAFETAARLGHSEAEVVDDLREQERPVGLVDDLPGVVQRAIVNPDFPTEPGWETVTSTSQRIVAAFEGFEVTTEPVVLVGHGLAWTLLVAHLTGSEPDYASWRALLVPDHCSINLHTGIIESPWGKWA